jgi:hypothetical protein
MGHSLVSGFLAESDCLRLVPALTTLPMILGHLAFLPRYMLAPPACHRCLWTIDRRRRPRDQTRTAIRF